MTASARWADKAPKPGQKVLQFKGRMEDYRVGRVFETFKAPKDQWVEIGEVWLVWGGICYYRVTGKKPSCFIWAFHEDINRMHKWVGDPIAVDNPQNVEATFSRKAVDMAETPARQLQVCIPGKVFDDPVELVAYVKTNWPGVIHIQRGTEPAIPIT